MLAAILRRHMHQRCQRAGLGVTRRQVEADALPDLLRKVQAVHPQGTDLRMRDAEGGLFQLRARFTTYILQLAEGCYSLLGKHTAQDQVATTMQQAGQIGRLGHCTVLRESIATVRAVLAVTVASSQN